MVRRSLPSTGAATARLGRGTAYAALAVLAPAFCFLYGLDAFPLRDNNEGLYAEIAREMLATGQWIIPHLNGVPYIEKPPLLYWLMGLSMALFGPTVAAARLVSAAAMLCLCAGMCQFCRRHGHERAGCYASVGLASSVPVALISHTVLFDPLLTALMGGCLLCFLHYYLTGHRRAYLLSSFLLALAVLEKGALALVLAGGIVGLFLLCASSRRSLRSLADPVALAILVGVAGPWHAAAAWLQDGFSWFYFVNEHVLRFLGRREPHDYHSGPIYYYLPLTVFMLLPWSGFLLLLLPKTAAAAGRAPDGTLGPFCRAWLWFPLLFFSLSQAKAAYYLLVTAPALLILLAVEVARRVQESGDRRLASCWGMAVASCILALWAVPAPDPALWRGQQIVAAVLAWAAMALLAGRFFVRLRRERERDMALLCVAAAVAPILLLAFQAAAQRSIRQSSWQVAQIVLGQGGARTVFIYRDFEDVFSTLPFYLNRTIQVIDSDSRDLQFGCRVSAAARSACISGGQFKRYCEHHPVAVAVRADRADAFRAMAGETGWRVEAAGQRLVFFSDR